MNINTQCNFVSSQFCQNSQIQTSLTKRKFVVKNLKIFALPKTLHRGSCSYFLVIPNYILLHVAFKPLTTSTMCCESILSILLCTKGNINAKLHLLLPKYVLIDNSFQLKRINVSFIHSSSFISSV